MQNRRVFFEFSISAILTLLVNGIVRPLNDHAFDDLQRVDTWLQVIDILATSAERADLLQKKEFLVHMRTWMLKVMREAMSGRKFECEDQAYLTETEAVLEDKEDAMFEAPGLANFHPDVFPLDQLAVNQLSGSWVDNANIAWPYLMMHPTSNQ